MPVLAEISPVWVSESIFAGSGGSRVQSWSSWRVTLGHFRSCRIERVDYAYASALACMFTHGWLDPVGDIAQLSPSFQ
jgi:hypothetical protein